MAGVAIGLVGEGICFLINALSYLAVLAALLALELPAGGRLSPTPLGKRLTEGVHYAFGFAPVRSLLLLLTMVTLMGAPYGVLLPIFATKVLHGGPHTLGLLTAAAGMGALLGVCSWPAGRTCGASVFGSPWPLPSSAWH